MPATQPDVQQKRFKQALNDLRNGEPVLLYDDDDREGEVDMVYAAEHITPEKIAKLRNDAGGLVCCAIAADAADQLGIPYYRNAVDHPTVEQDAQDYGDKSSFALWVNYDDTYTGITDEDRATTITVLADMIADGDADENDFADRFHTPGHVALLHAAPGLLQDRQGHTEMSVYLAKKANLTPATVICEMLDDETGEALSVEDAEAYADEHGLTFLSGEAVQKDFEQIISKLQF